MALRTFLVQEPRHSGNISAEYVLPFVVARDFEPEDTTLAVGPIRCCNYLLFLAEA